MKAVLISIQPKWCELIANRKKTVEVRKTKPKLETPFKVYIYCTNNKRQWLRKLGTSFREIFITENRDVLGRTEKVKSLIGEDTTFWESGGYNGKVIGEFVCKAILPISITYSDPNSSLALRDFPFTCLTDKEIMDYLGNGKEGYGWHISDLVIYDKPKELSEFFVYCDRCDKRPIACKFAYEESNENGYYSECMCDFKRPIERPPQSWCYVEELAGGKNG